MASDIANALFSGLDTATNKVWREEDRRWRQEDVAYREYEREMHTRDAEWRRVPGRRAVREAAAHFIMTWMSRLPGLYACKAM